MKSITQWLEEYGVSHQNQTNKLIHYLCVPAIYMTVLGLLWSIPFPVADMPLWVNWSTVLAIPALLFYFSLSSVVGLGMTVFTALMVVFLQWWQLNMAEYMSVLIMSVVVFVVAWSLQFVGHNIEGKKPSFLKDVQFLLIGPAWILCFVYKKLNIKF
ncbi:Mpo1-like protein [Psychrosphaera aquimarina]|uniref:Mpo1-like protein n=1 Tax=Psychrosphaera aquimarina TaxID=2044854 RepID=A0ABU3R4R0_9GAMM|nr:Mpo1-like protein [Psychrosphaera aquimarina]MDU0114660.1 Mpo1-like protein [Psychrosphaera aquimarina]